MEGSSLVTVLTVGLAAHKVIAAAIQLLQAPETLLGLAPLSCRSSYGRGEETISKRCL